MPSNCARRNRLLRTAAAAPIAGLALASVPVSAQTTLPGIVVTTPSPVVRARPAPQSAPIAAAPVAAPAAAPASTVAPPSTVADPLVLTPPPGVLIVVTDSFAPVTVTTGREIESNPGQTLTDTLATKPGIIGSNFAAGASRPIIRGLDNARVRVQENGIGSHDVSTLSEDHAVPIDPFAADRVEVVRGPATLRYGSQAIGGVVAVENNRIPSFVPPRGFTAEVKGGLSSGNDGRDGAFTATAGSGAFAVHADAFKRTSRDYETPQGKQANTFAESEGFAVGGSLIGSQGFIGIAFARVTSLYGIPGAEALEHFPRIDLEQDKLMARGEWRVRSFGIDAIRFWYGASDYAHNEVITEDGANLVGTRFTNKEKEARVEVQHTPVRTGLGELTGALGVQWGEKRLAGVAVDEPVDGLLDPAKANSVAAFLFEELQLTRALKIQAAGRVEQSRVEGTAVDLTDPLNFFEFQAERTFRPLSGGLGLLYQLPMGVVARLNGQYVERVPEAQELFSKGVHEATGTFEIGNPNLGKERARTIELGFAKADGRFRFDASAFHTRFDGFIFKRLTGEECGEVLAECPIVGGAPAPGEEGLNEVLFEQRDATFRGLELAAQLDVAPIWNGVWGIDGRYDFVHATFQGDGNVPRIPPHRLGGGLFYRDGQWLARVGVLHAFRQDRIATEETATSGYTLLDAEISYTLKLAGSGAVVPEMRIGVRGDNLLDDDVRNHVSFKKDEVLLPGANIRLFGSIKLN